MKKYLLVGVISILSLGAFLASCSKDDDDNKKMCTCTESDGDGYSATKSVDPATFSVSSCAELQSKLNDFVDDFYYSCY